MDSIGSEKVCSKVFLHSSSNTHAILIEQRTNKKQRTQTKNEEDVGVVACGRVVLDCSWSSSHNTTTPCTVRYERYLLSSYFFKSSKWRDEKH